MIDIDASICALKSSWVKRMLYRENSNLHYIYKKSIKSNNEQFIFKCSISDKLSHSLYLTFNLFVKEVLAPWIMCTNTHLTKIVNQLKGNNIIIAQRNRDLFFRKLLFDSCIIYLQNLLDYRTKTFYTLAEMTRI